MFLEFTVPQPQVHWQEKKYFVPSISNGFITDWASISVLAKFLFKWSKKICYRQTRNSLEKIQSRIAILCILFINCKHPQCGCTEKKKNYLCWAFTIIFIISNNSSIQREKLANLKRKKRREKKKEKKGCSASLPLHAGNTTYRRLSPHSRVGNGGIFFWFFQEDLWWNRNGMEWHDRHIWSTDLADTFSQLVGNWNKNSLLKDWTFHVHILAYHYLKNTLTIRILLCKNTKYQQSNSLTFPSTI